MKHLIIPPNHPHPYGSLVLTVDDDERAALHDARSEDPNKSLSDWESEALEHLIANSELDWVSPAETADLTEAPMLGIRGEQVRHRHLPADRHGETQVGGDRGGLWYAPILHRWAFMPYAVRSFIDDLTNDGRAVFIGS